MNILSFKKNLSEIRLYNLLFLTIAGTINAVGVTLFLTPVSLYDGGFSGLSYFLSTLTPLSLSLYLLILNVPFYVLGFKKLRFPFIVYSLWAIGVYALWAWLFQSVLPLDFSQGSPIAGSDLLLCAVFGGLISGIGSGLTIRFGGAIDGVEVCAVLFAKKLNLSVGTFVMIFNVVVYVCAGAVNASWQIPLYSVIAYAVGLKAVDFVINGFDKAKAAFIITTEADKMADVLSEKFGRGVTVMDAFGYYSQKDKAVVYCVVNRFEVAKLKKYIIEVDDVAFVAITDVSDFVGKGLRFGAAAKAERLAKENALHDKPNNVDAPAAAVQRTRARAHAPEKFSVTNTDTAEQQAQAAAAVDELVLPVQGEKTDESSDDK